MNPSLPGRHQLEGLTRGWYGVTLFGALLGLFTSCMSRLAFTSLIATGIATSISLLFVFLIGRSLLNRSAFMRGTMLVLASLMTCVGTYGLFRLVVLEAWSWSSWIMVLNVAAGLAMNVRSVKVLTSRSANAYFGGTV